MKPEIMENWDKALLSLKEADAHLLNNEPESAIKKSWDAVGFGAMAIREIEKPACGMAAEFLFDDFSKKHGKMAVRDVVDEARKTLKNIWNLVPKEYNFPEVPDRNLR